MILNEPYSVVSERNDNDIFVSLRGQLQYVQKHIPYYRSLFKELDFFPSNIQSIDDIRKIPLLTKSMVKNNPSHFRKKNLLLDQRSKSSGSTGEPFESYFDLTSWVRKKYWNKFKYRYYCGLRPGDKVAVLECCDGLTILKKNSVAKVVYPWLRIRYFSIYDDPEEVLTNLEQFRPDNICGYPGYLIVLARVISKYGVIIKNVHRIFTSSESLNENSRKYIEQQFCAPVYDHYGSTEFKEVALQCQHRDAYHVNTDEVLVELVDIDHPDKWASRGDIVITDLRNKAMPLIRYQTGDIGQLTYRCKCGCDGVMIKPVGGRSIDQLLMNDGRLMSPYFLTTKLEKFVDLIQFQIIQRNRGDVMLKTVWSTPPDDELLKSLRANLELPFSEGMSIGIKVVNSIAAEENGKVKVFKQYLNQDVFNT